MPKRTKSSRRWLDEHESDVYVQRARAEGFRSRAAFKLEDIQRTDRILRPGMTIVDLGAAPGGWSQYAAKLLRGNGRIVALDILLYDPGDPEDDAWADEMYGLLCEARAEGRLIDVPLGECEARKGSPNRQLLKDYSYWFWNNR